MQVNYSSPVVCLLLVLGFEPKLTVITIESYFELPTEELDYPSLLTVCLRPRSQYSNKGQS